MPNNGNFAPVNGNLGASENQQIAVIVSKMLFFAKRKQQSAVFCLLLSGYYVLSGETAGLELPKCHTVQSRLWVLMYKICIYMLYLKNVWMEVFCNKKDDIQTWSKFNLFTSVKKIVTATEGNKS